ncbi:MAG: macrocin-O-methyltransferase [Oxalobacteraceae bacterium]|nr:MAG: macrocin-O-methyltransferase [Oxalobacteraceae bacterium]
MSSKGRNRFDSTRLHRLIASSRVARVASIGILAKLELVILGGHKQVEVMRSIHAARIGRESLLSGNEAFTVFSLARSQRSLPGVMAEVGVYQGVSARLISQGSGGAPLHLFDTFAGLPTPDASEHSRMREGHYAASLSSVRTFLSDCPEVFFHPGLFPDTSVPCAADRFSFVHLDVDLKSSTLDCLNFFYPRMLPGGIILSHDFSYLDGVREAFTEFFDSRPEQPIELATSQAMLVKR